MQTIFSSPFLIENTSEAAKNPFVKGQIIRHFQKAEYAISYHLERAIPKGGVVCAFFPKSILAQILPKIAKEKNCKVISVNGTRKATTALMAAGVIDNQTKVEDADIYITEPNGFTPGGALATPEEEKVLKNFDVIGVGSYFQATKRLPADHDFIKLTKIISELGIHSPEQFHTELSAFF